MSIPKVSVVSVSYNQEKFIQQALEGFVSQKTNFDFEVIICDDSSTDGTQEIIKEYTTKYPDIIKPLLRKKNVGIQENVKSALMRAIGDYVALCEGDDFWIDPRKLQKQADFLDKNTECNLVFHPVRILFENHKEKKVEIYPEVKNRKFFTYKKLLEGNFIQTNSVMYRRKPYDSVPTNILPMDWYLHLMHAKGGEIGFLSDVMGVYRRHDQGVWWESHKNISNIWRQHGIGHLNVYHELLNLVGNNKQYRKIIYNHIRTMFDNIFDLEDADDMKKQVVVEFPEATQRYLSDARKKYLDTQKRLDQITLEFEQLKDECGKLSDHAKSIENQLELIRSSRVWKARTKAVRLMGRDGSR